MPPDPLGQWMRMESDLEIRLPTGTVIRYPDEKAVSGVMGMRAYAEARSRAIRGSRAAVYTARSGRNPAVRPRTTSRNTSMMAVTT